MIRKYFLNRKDWFNQMPKKYKIRYSEDVEKVTKDYRKYLSGLIDSVNSTDEINEYLKDDFKHLKDFKKYYGQDVTLFYNSYEIGEW